MDITTIGIDMAIVGGIIALCNVIKGFDSTTKYKRFYPVLPLALGLLAAYFKTDPFAWKAFGLAGIIYVGTSSYMFQFGKTTLFGK
jgi:hypothetical protein